MALVTDPTNPLPGDTVDLSISGATGATSATRFVITSVPTDSSIEVGELVDAAGEPVQYFVPDVAGAYAVTAYDYRRYAGIAAYPGAPNEARDILVATQTGTVYVADTLDLPIATADHAVTLRLTVANASVADASLVSPTTEKARLCALDSTVLAAVAALEGQSVSGLGQSLVTDAPAFVTALNGHLGNSAGMTKVHDPADSVNTIEARAVTSVSGAIATLNEVADKLTLHLTTNEDGWHGQLDWTNVPIAARANDVASAFVLDADLRRVYPTHIATTGSIHGIADTTYTLTADALLTDAIQAVLSFFASAAPSTPSGENAGKVAAVAKYGFKLAD